MIPANAMEMLDEAFTDPKLGSFLHQLESVLLAGVMRTKTQRRMQEAESLEEEKLQQGNLDGELKLD
jgi:hypothetical protein